LYLFCEVCVSIDAESAAQSLAVWGSAALRVSEQAHLWSSVK
jgi:hypothetical protein